MISNEEGVLLQVRLGRLLDPGPGSGPGPGAEPVTIGRAGDNTVISTDRRTSRHHARIRAVALEEGEVVYEVEDAGSTYGTLLNGRPITRERLGHNDLVDCGGLRVQFQLVEDAAAQTEAAAAAAEASATSAGAAAAEAEELRAQVHRLIEEDAELRQAVGRAQEAEALAARRLTEALDETSRLRGVVDELQKEGEAMKARIEALGQDLRNERGLRAQAQGAQGAQEALAEAQRQIDRQRQRIGELEAREGELVLAEGRLKKEIEHLRAMNEERDRRQADLPQALQRAAKRIQELSIELEKTRMQLAQAQGDLDALRRGSR